jgi:serine/threonine-protein kinase
VPAQLEALVLACLSKEPDRRPQSAAELRCQLEACAIEPWDSVMAAAWWTNHQPELEGTAKQSAGHALTIAIDGASRR